MSVWANLANYVAVFYSFEDKGAICWPSRQRKKNYRPGKTDEFQCRAKKNNTCLHVLCSLLMSARFRMCVFFGKKLIKREIKKVGPQFIRHEKVVTKFNTL